MGCPSVWERVYRDKSLNLILTVIVGAAVDAPATWSPPSPPCDGVPQLPTDRVHKGSRVRQSVLVERTDAHSVSGVRRA